MSRYIDGFAVSVPTANLQAYRELAHQAGTIWGGFEAIVAL